MAVYETLGVVCDLTDLQRMFVHYYLEQGMKNATNAARRAGYKHPNVQSAALMKNKRVKKYLDAFLEQSAMTAAEAIYRRSKTARNSLADFLDISQDGSSADINFDYAREQGQLDQIKKFKKTVTHTPQKNADPIERIEYSIELYASDSAQRDVLSWHQRSATTPPDADSEQRAVDFDELTDEQLEAIFNGTF